MVKKIKTFTTDEEIYKRLVSMFKKYKVETSISMYLNFRLKWLMERLDDIEKGIKEMNSPLPMKYVIEEIISGSFVSGRISSEPDQEKGNTSDLERYLIDFEQGYEAYKKGVPFEYYNWLKSGRFVLSNNKKFIIEKDTGKKFISMDGNNLMEVREIDNKKFKRE